ncbi:MAG TPA: ATP-binding protein [Acidobacteriota bacterium]|jgi:anti-sigma regulatory factor (Ser/Thr protein kinase)
MKEFVTKNNLAELETLTEEIFNYYLQNGIAEDACYEIRLALEEAISNTIKYGYEDKQAHTIHVKAGIETNQIFLQIEDDANAFNPLEAATPDLSLPLEKKPIGRLGIYLMRTVMDGIDYKRAGTKNILKMTKVINTSR